MPLENIKVFNAGIQQMNLTLRPGVVVELPEAFDGIRGLIFRFSEQTPKVRLQFSNSYIHSCFAVKRNCMIPNFSFFLKKEITPHIPPYVPHIDCGFISSKSNQLLHPAVGICCFCGLQYALN